MIFLGEIKNKKVLLHACCGPCSLGCIQPLEDDGAIITLYYYNDCIFDEEFEKRLEALKAVAGYYSLSLIVPRHKHSKYLEYAESFADENEGGRRCELCFNDRLSGAASFAKLNDYDCFATTLTVSPHKNSKKIFEIAEKISSEYKIPFLERDFKKQDGFLRSCELSKKLGIYRQKFCGCEFSLR